MVVKPYAPPLPPDLTLYDMPRVQLGDMVLSDSSPEWRNPRPGWVVSKTDKEVTVLVPTDRGQFITRFNCVHRSDPRCERQRDRFLDNESGVFELSDNAERLQRLEDTIAELKQEILSLRSGGPSGFRTPAPPLSDRYVPPPAPEPVRLPAREPVRI